MRSSACGSKRRTASSGERVLFTDETRTCWDLEWKKTSNGEWSAIKYWQRCNKPLCSTTNVNIRKGPCTWYSKVRTTANGEQIKATGRTAYGCGYTWMELEDGWAVKSYFGECSSSSSSDGGKTITSLTKSQLRSCMSGLSSSNADKYLSSFNAALVEGNINTCNRISAFSAQVGHESASLYYWEELASGAAYEGRSDLCNTHTGDGKKYKGRGPIQLTGRCNYRDAGNALGLNLLDNPTIVSTKEVGFRTTIWYWNKRNLNKYADKGTQAGFDQVTYRVNGGYNGKADRDARYKACRRALGCPL